MDRERKAIWLENALIIAAIAALWPAILRWPARITTPFLFGALAAMLVVARQRWRRLVNLKKDRKTQGLVNGDRRKS